MLYAIVDNIGQGRLALLKDVPDWSIESIDGELETFISRVVPP